MNRQDFLVELWNIAHFNDHDFDYPTTIIVNASSESLALQAAKEYFNELGFISFDLKIYPKVIGR